MPFDFDSMDDHELKTRIQRLQDEVRAAIAETTRREEAARARPTQLGAIIDVSSLPKTDHKETYRYARAAIDGNGRPVVLFSMNTRHWTGGPVLPGSKSRRAIEFEDPAYTDPNGPPIHYHTEER